MSRGSAYALLAVLSAGVFLAGLELMVTAVALPTIIQDFSSNTQNPFAELRRASWIVNGYLLAYVVAMPLAGRMADVWGARRMFLAALAAFIVGSLLAGPGPVDRRADRRPCRPGHRRRNPRAGRDGCGVAPVRGPRPAAGARRHRRADVPRDGRRSVRRGGDPRRARRPRRPHRARRRPERSAPERYRAVVAVGLLPQRPDRHRRPARRLGRVGRLGDAAALGRDRHRRGGHLERRARRCAGRGDPARQPRRRAARTRFS